MPNILEVTYNFPCEVFISRHVKALENAGCQVQLVARHADDNYTDSSTVSKNTEINSMPKILPQFDHLSIMNKVISLRYLKNSKWKLSRRDLLRDRVMLGYFKKLNPDLIHFHFGTLAGMMSWIPQELGIPYTLSLRGSDIQVAPLSSLDQEDLLRDGITHAAGIHTVSDNLWDLAEPYIKQPVLHKTIYTTIPIPETPLFSTINREKNERYTLVAIGRLHWRKSYVNLLLAIKSSLDHGLPIDLTIIGEGPDRDSLVYWINALDIAPHVILSGKLTYPDFTEYLKKSDGFIQSSIAEGFSNATAEAMSLGLPVFATDVGGTSEIIQDGINGYLLDPIHPQDWYKKICLVEDTILMEKIGKNAFETASEVFSAEKHAKEFIEFYTNILNAQ